MTLSPSRYFVLLLVIGVLALALRLGIAARFQGLESPPKFEANPDQVEYELLAFHLSTGAGYSLTPGVPSACRPPGTSFTLVPLYAVFGRSWSLGRTWFCLLSALTCLATAWVARPAFGPAVALLAALGLALYPGHFYYAMHFLSEVPFALYVTLACGCTLRALGGGTRGWDVLAGILWGMAVLTRPILLALLPLGALAVLLARRDQRRDLGLRWAVQTAVCLAVLTPWVVRNALVLGKPTLSTIVGGFTFWGAHNDLVFHDPQLRGSWVESTRLRDAEHPLRGGEVEKEAAAWRYGWEFVTTHAADMPGLCALKLWRLLTPFANIPNAAVYWAFALGWLGTAPFVVVGTVLMARRDRTTLVVLALPVLATVASVLVFYGSERFRDSLAPLFLIPAALAVVVLGNRWFGGKARRP